jgi:hypothetical protein
MSPVCGSGAWRAGGVLCVGLGLFLGLLLSPDLDVGKAELPDEFDQDADADEDVGGPTGKPGFPREASAPQAC